MSRSRRPHRPSRIAAAFLVLGFWSAGAAPGRVGFQVLSEIVSGDFGTEESGDLAALAVGFSFERKVRFSVEVPFIRAREAPVVVRTRVGTAPTRRGRGTEPPTADPGWEDGIGDVRLALSWPVTGGGAKLFRLDGEVEVKVPTADQDLQLGTGEWDVKLGLFGEYELWSAVLFGGVGFNWLGDPGVARGQTAAPELEDVFEAYFGVESETSDPRWRWAVWLEGHQEVVAGVGQRVAVGLGLRSVGKRAWRFSGTVGLSDAAEDFGILLGWDFHPRPRPGKRP